MPRVQSHELITNGRLARGPGFILCPLLIYLIWFMHRICWMVVMLHTTINTQVGTVSSESVAIIYIHHSVGEDWA